MGNYDELPQEITLDIMCRVPAKSVGLCRCVSKPWRALLSQPDFIKTHLQHAKTNALESLAFTHAISSSGSNVYLAPLNNANHMSDEKITLSLTKLSFPGFNPLSVYGIYGSCDGLLLAFSYEDGMSVMNPTTREIRQVPPSPVAVYCNDDYPVFFRYGFGYDSVTDDYKIVIIYFCYGLENGRYVTNDNIFDVYSLKIGSWKRLESSTYNYYIGLGLSAGAFVGGCLHWLHTRLTDNKVAIVAFDLVDGKVREVPLPSSISDNLEGFYIADLFRYKLGVLEGCLCMSYATEYIEVWVMKEYGVSKSWTKFVVNQPFGVLECSLRNQEQVVMRFHDDNHVPWNPNDDNHVLWNPKHKTSKKIVFNGFSGCSADLRVEANFVESLVSPHGRL